MSGVRLRADPDHVRVRVRRVYPKGARGPRWQAWVGPVEDTSAAREQTVSAIRRSPEAAVQAAYDVARGQVDLRGLDPDCEWIYQHPQRKD